MTKKEREKKVLFTINGFEVKENSIYSVSDKKDGDAPTGFVKAGVSKLPHDGVDETFGVRWVEVSRGKGVWDTGFYEYSPCYDGMSDEERKVMVSSLKKSVLDPYKKAIGDPTAFDQNDNAFFDNMLFKIDSRKVYNTENPIQRMELYFALRAYQVAPRGAEGDSKYRLASYVLNDNTKKVKDKDDLNVITFKATGVFQKLYENDRERLIAVLNWVGLKIGIDPDEGTLISMFAEYIRESYSRTKAFLDIVTETETEIGLNKLNIYKRLKEIVNKSNKITKSPNGTYFYDGDVEIGPDLKAASENIAKNKDLNRIKKEILLLEEEEL